MLKHAGACLRKLVRPFSDEPPLSSTALRKAEVVASVREKRDQRRQEVAFGARPFILCGLPIRLPHGCLRYSRRNGRFFLEILGHPDYGLPFGQDRLIPLWYATLEAVRQRNRAARSSSRALARFSMNGVCRKMARTIAGSPMDSGVSSAVRSSSERARRGRNRKCGIAVDCTSSSACVYGFDQSRAAQLTQQRREIS